MVESQAVAARPKCDLYGRISTAITVLQQDKPEDFVIATGVQYSVRDFVDAAAKELGMQIRWEGQGVDEKGEVHRRR